MAYYYTLDTSTLAGHVLSELMFGFASEIRCPYPMNVPRGRTTDHLCNCTRNSINSYSASRDN